MKKKINKSPLYLLDKFSVHDIKQWENIKNQVLEYYWNVYSVLAHQRAQVFDDLKKLFILNSQPYEFEDWQRVVTYAFTLNPLSAIGSIASPPGGRFNIGDIDESKFSKFPALYLAEDRKTAYMEKFGLSEDQKLRGVTAPELTLSETEPISIVSISGKLDAIFDVENKKALMEFVSITKGFKIPKKISEMAKHYKIEAQSVITNVDALYNSLLDPNWRRFPQQADTPSNSQIFGQIIESAGLQGILYKSKKTGKKCLAIFPKNFEGSQCAIELQGVIPPEVTNRRMDSASWMRFIQ